MTAPHLHAQVAEIQQLCSYLSDDRAIANYFGIPTEQVAGVRSRMRRPKNQRYPLHPRAEHTHEQTPQPVNRDPCPRCQTRRDIGCKHMVRT